ncbi:hypothetical protein QHH_05 [Halomonas phage QHHSV-1]|nr:hypothetical protein QHH_05 [Halomonas phage QHHSV-1]
MYRLLVWPASLRLGETLISWYSTNSESQRWTLRGLDSARLARVVIDGQQVPCSLALSPRATSSSRRAALLSRSFR